VSFISFSTECECEDVAQKFETTTLFRLINSGDINQPPKNVDCIQPSS